MRHLRFVTGAVGVALAAFGAYRLVTGLPLDDLASLSIWLVAAVVIHDGIVAPLTVAVGWSTSRLVPLRARGYVQGALTTGALVTVVALPLIYRQDSQPTSKAILQQDYRANLVLLLGVVASAAALAYALRVVRDRRRTATDVAS